MKTSNVLWGIFFIVMGVIFGLNALEITNINVFFDGWWTLFIIVPCFIDIFKTKDKNSSIIGLIIGLCLLLGCQDIIKFQYVWKLIIPIILVILGISLVFKDKISKEVKTEIKKLKKNNDKEYNAIFGSQNINFSNEEFKGCNINSIFGSVKCDLRESEIKENSSIEVSTIFGSVTINVPSDVNVKVISTPIFGGVSNNRKKKSKDTKVTLYINATCLFGGVEIK